MAFNYSPKIVTNGLVLYLDAANTKSYPGTGTTWTDVSRSRFNGTLTNGPTFNSGNCGNIVFDGVDDYIGGSGIDNISLLLGGSSAVSISMWVKRSALSAGTGRTFLGFSNSSGVHKLLINFNATNSISVFGRSANETGQGIVTTNTFTSLTDWYNIVGILIYGTNTILCYVNSILQPATGTISFSQSTLALGTVVGSNRIGSEILSSTLFPGNIAQTLIYNRSLTTTEILQNYNATKTRFGL
jgi:hypothetical protein